jgi:hypothetical protein
MNSWVTQGEIEQLFRMVSGRIQVIHYITNGITRSLRFHRRWNHHCAVQLIKIGNLKRKKRKNKMQQQQQQEENKELATE